MCTVCSVELQPGVCSGLMEHVARPSLRRVQPLEESTGPQRTGKRLEMNQDLQDRGKVNGKLLNWFCWIFKASALWADAFYKSIGPSVCVFVRLSVCLSVCSLLRYRLTVFLPPLPEVRCPIFLGIQNPWGKVMERCGLTFEHFCLEVV